MQITPHLAFNGQCAEAFRFYEKCLDGKIGMIMTYGESPMAGQTPPEQHGRVLHASLNAGGHTLTGADAPPDRYKKPQGVSILATVKDVAEADRVFNALAEGATVQMPLQETFWALRFGMLIDKYGTPWMINCEKPAA